MHISSRNLRLVPGILSYRSTFFFKKLVQNIFHFEKLVQNIQHLYIYLYKVRHSARSWFFGQHAYPKNQRRSWIILWVQNEGERERGSGSMEPQTNGCKMREREREREGVVLWSHKQIGALIGNNSDLGWEQTLLDVKF